MNTHHGRGLLQFCAALLAICTVLPGLSDTARAQTKVILSYSAAAAFANAYIAADQGLFAKHKVDVEMKLIPNSTTTPAALLADSIQIAGLTAATALQAADAGMEIVVLAGGSVTSKGPSEAAVLGRIDAGITKPQDFVGKRVATPGLNGFLHVLFRQWLTAAGVDWRKVTFVEVPFAQLGDVLRAGQVDAALVSEPFKSRALDSKAAYLIAPYVAEGPSGIFSTWYIATRKWAAANPDAVKAFKAAMAEATKLTTNDEIARKAVAAYTKLPPAALAQTPIPQFQSDVKAADVDAWVKIALEQDLIKTKLDPARVLEK